MPQRVKEDFLSSKQARPTIQAAECSTFILLKENDIEKAKCNSGHEGKSKKDKNAYGELLDKLLDRKKDAKNPEKIRQALAAVESEKSPSGETYGDLLKEGKLP